MRKKYKCYFSTHRFWPCQQWHSKIYTHFFSFLLSVQGLLHKYRKNHKNKIYAAVIKLFLDFSHLIFFCISPFFIRSSSFNTRQNWWKEIKEAFGMKFVCFWGGWKKETKIERGKNQIKVVNSLRWFFILVQLGDWEKKMKYRSILL